MDVCEERSWSLYVPQSVPQSPVNWAVTKACAHFKVRGYLLLLFCDYLLSHVSAAMQQILKGGDHKFQSNQPKTRENVFIFVLPWLGVWNPDLSVLSLLPCHMNLHKSSIVNPVLVMSWKKLSSISFSFGLDFKLT